MNSGQKCAHPVELLSVYPTLNKLCGLPERDDLEGRVLLPLLQDANADWPHNAVTTHGHNNHAVRSETHRYIRYHDGSEELYDLVRDPNEWTNLADRPDLASIKAKLAQSIPAKNAAPARAAAAEKRAKKGRSAKKKSPQN